MSMTRRRQRYRTQSSKESGGKEEEKKPEFFAAAKEKGSANDKAPEPAFFAPKPAEVPAMAKDGGSDKGALEAPKGEPQAEGALEHAPEAEAAPSLEPDALAPEAKEADDNGEGKGGEDVEPPKKEEDDEAQP